MRDDYRARFEEIYEAYSGQILAYAARRTPDLNDAADVVAETFTVAWRRLGDVPSGDEARPWLYGVARRVLANQRRGAARRRRLDERLAAEFTTGAFKDTTAPDPAGSLAGDPAGDPAEVEAISAAFNALTDGDRELLTLVGWEGLGRAEIATMLGCSQATVRVRLHRARRRFAAHLAQAGMKRSVPRGHESGTWATAHADIEETTP